MSQIAIVTGANKGIGLEIARKLCLAGCKTILGCRNPDLGRAVERDFKALGFDAEYRQVDLGDEASIKLFWYSNL